MGVGFYIEGGGGLRRENLRGEGGIGSTKTKYKNGDWLYGIVFMGSPPPLCPVLGGGGWVWSAGWPV